MDEKDLKHILEEKNQRIKELQQETVYWRRHYSKVLNAYFELHKYCNNHCKDDS